MGNSVLIRYLKTIMKIIYRLIIYVQKFILIAASLMLLIAMLGETTLRYIGDYSLLGIEEIIILIAYWLYFIGAAHGSCEKSHINADILHAFLKTKHLVIINTFICLISLGLTFLFTQWAYDYFTWSLQKQPESPVFRYPLVWAQSSILFGFGLIVLYSIIDCADKIRLLINNYQ